MSSFIIARSSVDIEVDGGAVHNRSGTAGRPVRRQGAQRRPAQARPDGSRPGVGRAPTQRPMGVRPPEPPRSAVTPVEVPPAEVPAVRLTSTTLRSRPRDQRPTSAPMRLTRRGRLVLSTVITTTVVSAVLMVSSMAVASLRSGSTPPVRYLRVQPGQTMFAIASSVAKPGKTLQMIDEIESLNSLNGPALRAGQRLAIPQP